jgi:hypothetical protein
MSFLKSSKEGECLAFQLLFFITQFNAVLLEQSPMKPADTSNVSMTPTSGEPTRSASFSREPAAGVRSLNIGKVIEPFDKKLHSNVVVTSRYNVLTFLPMNLFEQVFQPST